MRLHRYFAMSALLTGCHFGNSAKSFEPATMPSGIVLAIDTAKGGARVIGELLAIDSSGLRVLTDNVPRKHVLQISYARMRSTRFRQIDVTISRSTPPTPAQLARLRPLSRFPQGMSESVARNLLSAYNIPAVEVVR